MTDISFPAAVLMAAGSTRFQCEVLSSAGLFAHSGGEPERGQGPRAAIENKFHLE